MITGIAVRNFKSIGKDGVALQLKPLTILVGQNGAGKSTIMEAIALMSQSVGRQLSFTGTLINFPSPNVAFHKGNTREPLELGVKIQLTQDEITDLENGKRNAKVDIPFMSELMYLYAYQQTTMSIISQKLMTGDNVLAELKTIPTSPTGYTYRLYYPAIKQEGHALGSYTNFLHPEAFQTHSISGGYDLNAFNSLIGKMISCFTKRLHERVFMLYSTRGRIEHNVTSPSDSNWVGSNGEYLLNILAKIYGRQGYEQIANNISNWASKFGINSLRAGWWGKEGLGSDYTDKELGTVLNTALAGHGSRQALTMITQIFWSKEGDVSLIEEPEISLHPDSQALLPELFAHAIKENKTIVVTTHSEFLLLALSRPIRDNLLSQDDVAVYYCKKEKGKGTAITKLEVTKQGYVKGWVPSFASIEKELLKEFLESAPEK